MGCILGDPDELFIGEVLGVGHGRFEVESSQGATCQGSFKRALFGTAKVKATCRDGRKARATFGYYQKQPALGAARAECQSEKKSSFGQATGY
ncbi:hypothetical protein [Shimia abyssi]|uniref:Uncharacterized protein n=1 Tax=Shimia abyssi TaxID=1662395 RepID=A0A2P8F6R3_9RHOB|nr:hypothetical protein [Shimia abyssi]PSL17413.1 hypothetical protein CLV88_11888 [Shimia abyssi]